MARKRKRLTAADGEVMSYHKFYATLDQRLNEIISDLSNPSTSDEQRSQAKSEFKFCKENDLNTVVDELLILLEHPPNIDVLKMSATLLGDIFEKSESTRSRVVDKLVYLLVHSLLIDVREKSATLLGNICEKSKSTPSPVKISCLLDCVVKKENRPIIVVLGDTISKLKPDEKVANTLLEGLASDNTSVQECTLLIFPQLVQYVFDCKVPYLNRLHGVFKKCLGNEGSANVRIAALIAATSFIQRLVIYEDSFQDLLPGMMHCLVEVLNGGDEAMKQKALVLLVKLAETKPRFFRGQLVEVVERMSQIADTESLEERTRNLAITFVITLVEVSNWGPADIRVRAMSAVLLGNLFKQSHPMSESTYSRVKGYLLDCVVKEENKPIIEILGYSISMLADKNVADFLLNHVANLQESAILIFPHVVQYVMASDASYTLPLRILFKNRLTDVGSANVRIAALIAVTSFIQCEMSSNDGDWFQDSLMQCVNESFNGGDEAMTQKALVLLIEFAETSFFTEHLLVKLAKTDPRFFKRQLDVVVRRMSQIAAADNLEKGTRLLAKKFLITLNEAQPDTSMPDMLEIVGNLRQFRLQEGIASDQTRTPAIEKLLRQFEEKLPPNTWASRWSSLRLKSILARKEN